MFIHVHLLSIKYFQKSGWLLRGSIIFLLNLRNMLPCSTFITLALTIWFRFGRPQFGHARPTLRSSECTIMAAPDIVHIRPHSDSQSISLRTFQQTPGTDPRYPKIQIWKDFLYKWLVEGLGYVRGVCRSLLRISQSIINDQSISVVSGVNFISFHFAATFWLQFIPALSDAHSTNNISPKKVAYTC